MSAPGWALVLLDMQNDVVDATGALAPAAGQQVAVDAALHSAARCLDRARAAGAVVAHVAVRFRAGYPEIDRYLPIFDAVATTGSLVEGTWGADFHPSVAPGPGEPVFAKRGIDAFAGNDLALVLRRSGVDEIYLAGVSTNLVVLSTAFSSIDHGFRAVIVADACASSASSEAHLGALELSRPVARHTTSAALPG